MPGNDRSFNPNESDSDSVTENTYPTWEKAAEAALRGKDFNDLTTRTFDEIERLPLYTRERNATPRNEEGLPGNSSFARGHRASGNVLGWQIRQQHLASTVGANEQILADLESGASAITLKGAPETTADLNAVLNGVFLDMAPVHLAAGSNTAQAQALVKLCTENDADQNSFSNNLGLDPLTQLARTGHLNGNLTEIAEQITELAFQVDTNFPNIRPISAEGTVWSDAGASDSQELAAVLSTGVFWLKSLTAQGMSIEKAAGQIELGLSAGPDQFLTMAKFRAARICWARIIDASGGNPAVADILIHAGTSNAMMTLTDAWVNILRTTTACFAAAAGGADSITVAPFDSIAGLSSNSALRLARNTQLILQEETRLASVIDPGGGSWYIEDLSDQLAKSSWKIFQEIEGLGGIGEALISGAWQAELSLTRNERMMAIADRSMPLTGTSEFPDLDEIKLERAPLPDPAEIDGEQLCQPVPLFRWSSPFESIRESSEAIEDQPLMFMANLGDIATHTARATFAKNLFEAGGIRTSSNDGFLSADLCIEAFTQSASRIACICSSDAMYSEMALEVARNLKEAGAELVYLAGNPKMLPELENQIDGFVYLGCNVLEALAGIHKMFGAEEHDESNS